MNGLESKFFSALTAEDFSTCRICKLASSNSSGPSTAKGRIPHGVRLLLFKEVVMPNWVSNTVTPLNETAVSFTREHIVDEKGEFCFSRLVPLPRELSKTSSPNRIVSSEEMQMFKDRYADRVCTEYEQEGLLYVEHPSGFIESCCTAECARTLVKRFGAADWYTFTNSHWGCKWDACCRKHDDTSYFFDTPWSYPETFTEVMAASCPEGHWQWRWEEEQGFGGIFEIRNGIIVHTDSWDIPEEAPAQH